MNRFNKIAPEKSKTLALHQDKLMEAHLLDLKINRRESQ
jgi:hypothetical protein